MVFSSLVFIFVFLPIVLIIYHLSKDKYKNYILLAFSILFYSWGEPKYILLMIFSIVISYFLAILIDKNKSQKRKFYLILAIIINIGLLFVFKYLDFSINLFNSIFSTSLPLKNIMLPIGISFYTFQILSYVIDVYKKEVKVQKNILYLGAYISLFPQLIAGPIVRYSTIEEQLHHRTESFDKVKEGVMRFIIGLGKKVIISNNIAIIADAIFNNSELLNFNSSIVILGAIAYTLQIYYDFSGYSDMAIGLGKMFGFDFLENFNYPYCATSITNFWKRWHISLSSFFRDYIYIPLGGNRVKKWKWIRNILIVWALTGLWHGASLNFLLWGLYFGSVLLLEKLLLNKVLEKCPKVIRWLYTMIIVMISWIIFRVENVESLFVVLGNLFSFKNINLLSFFRNNYNLLNYIPYIIIGFIFIFPLGKKIHNEYNKNLIFKSLYFLILLLIFCVSICFLIGNSYNPFIYFRF